MMDAMKIVIQLMIQEEDMIGCVLPVTVQKEKRSNDCAERKGSIEKEPVIKQMEMNEKKIRASCQRDGTSDYSSWKWEGHAWLASGQEQARGLFKCGW
jgi:hypothetical protein